mmetsp:Transcript_26865/g.60719  ORF Transcript_26865/g.60719 Transcript_26865/m.60719 type:complete len:82 (+) Transcript_26865:556-801(+)
MLLPHECTEYSVDAHGCAHVHVHGIHSSHEQYSSWRMRGNRTATAAAAARAGAKPRAAQTGQVAQPVMGAVITLPNTTGVM